MKIRPVTAAILNNKNQILCVRRGISKYDYISNKWEFPGGKAEEGESLTDCLSRELKEELAIDVCVTKEDHFVTVTHDYPDFTITMHAYRLELNSRDLTLVEHKELKWLSIEDMPNLDWAGADRPIVEKLMAKN